MKTNQRGFVLVSVLVIALLYFGLLQLMLIESSQALRGAQRFRTRIVAQTLAENAAELAAHQILYTSGKTVKVTSLDGRMEAKSWKLPGQRFEIEATGTSAGTHSHSSTVTIAGHFEGAAVRIDRTQHSQ